MARGRDAGADPLRVPAGDGALHEPADVPAGRLLLGPPLRVVFAGSFAGPDLERLRERLPWAELEVVAADALRVAAARADVLVTNRLAAGDLDGADRLRLVQAFSAGTDRIDRRALPAGVPLANLEGHERAVAEWCLAAIVVLTRRLLWRDAELRQGRWHRWEAEEARGLEGLVLGTVGFGAIGREVAGLARGLGVQTLAVTRRPRDGASGLDRLDELLRRADVVVLCVAGAAGTLVGARELDLLGPRGWLVNVARGRVVEERALYEALRERRIAGAALDVWWHYPSGPGETVPPSSLPFHELDNVVMTPHLSAQTAQTRERRWRNLAAQLERLHAGREPEHVVHVG